MLAIFVGTAVTCFAALFLGQAALRLAGAREWSWLAPSVGISVAMMVATPAIHVPGRCTTVAVLLGCLAAAAAIWCLRSPAHRPPFPGLLAALPVALLTAAPFLAAGRGGILGVTVNNDMSVHLLFLESYVSPAVESVSPLPADYPMGPHAVSAVLSQGLGIEAALAFSAFTMAIPLIGAWTVQMVAPRASWFGRVVVAIVAGLPFLVAAYYGQGSFKEVAQAVLVLAAALSLSGYGPHLERGRWVPFALLIGGMVSAFSAAGLPWPVAFAGLWLAGELAIAVRRGRLRRVPAVLRRELPAIGIGAAVLLAFLLPQAERVWQFLTLREGTGIAVTDIGNLIGPLPGWEALGAWPNPDFRVAASPAFEAAWSVLVLALVLLGAFWAFRRRHWLLPLCAAAAIGIWALSGGSQSPYVTAKALVIASPLLLVLAALPLVDEPPPRRRRRPWLGVTLLGLVLLVGVGTSDLRTMLWTPVGPTNHAGQLRSFRPLLTGKPTLVLGNDEFLAWSLAGVPVQAAALVELPVLPLRPSKDWQGGEAMDFDTLLASTINDYEWIVTPRDPASSSPPTQMRLVQATRDFELWRRVGRVPERAVLGEGEWPGAVLECGTRGGRTVLAGGGVAAVRPRPVVAPLPKLDPGESASVHVDLPAGRWELETPYTSSLPVKVTAPGFDAELPPNLDRPGPRLRIGPLWVRGKEGVSLSVQTDDMLLALGGHVTTLRFLVATPVRPRERVVPIRQACGHYVDWYRSAR